MFLTTLYHISVHKNTIYYRIHATLLYFFTGIFQPAKISIFSFYRIPGISQRLYISIHHHRS
nr:MAG TPA: hypothetical protein [Caudoviricetes sp.]